MLEGVLNQLAPRTKKEKAYARERCTFVDANGARCAHWSTGASRPYLCMQHGGKIKCHEEGCDAFTADGIIFCAAHKGVKCKAEGCKRVRVTQAGYCSKHSPGALRKQDEEEAKEAEAYEECRRRKRLRGLRDEWLPTIMTAQNERCARSWLTCADVHNGKATSVCPWGLRPVPRDAAQLDHITPLCEGGTDERANLQALCACCHALKSAAEARKRARERKRELEACQPLV